MKQAMAAPSAPVNMAGPGGSKFSKLQQRFRMEQEAAMRRPPPKPLAAARNPVQKGPEVPPLTNEKAFMTTAKMLALSAGKK